MVAHAAQPCLGSSCCCPLAPWLQLLLLLPLLMRAHNSFHYCFDILFIECEQACVRPTPALAEVSLFPSFSPPFVAVVAGAGQIFFAQIVNGLVSFCSNKWNQCPCHSPCPCPCPSLINSPLYSGIICYTAARGSCLCGLAKQKT